MSVEALFTDASYVAKDDLRGYARSDFDAIDYRMWTAPLLPFHLRGPGPSESLKAREYIVCIGAAQTFGRFNAWPFPALLEQHTGIKVLNLGFDGAGPGYFLNPTILSILQNARLVIAQVMSGRSLSNSEFVSPDNGGSLMRRKDGPNAKRGFALDVWREWLQEVQAQTEGKPNDLRRRVDAVIAETRLLWTGYYAQLRHKIGGHCILFYFSKRPMAYAVKYSHAELLLGEFPQMIDEDCVQSVSPLFDDLVMCVSDRGSPQPLFNRFSGEPFIVNPSFRFPDHNAYYPRPEMHQDAVEALGPAVMRILSGHS